MSESMYLKYNSNEYKQIDLNQVPIPSDLNCLIDELHKVFEFDTVNIDYVRRLLENYKSNQKDWKHFAKYDPYKYTRNLVNKGNGKFNIIILCWAESQGSSIHDHANSNCFFKMLDGELTETKYEWPIKEGEPMIECEKFVFKKDQVSYINDSIGLHRVENASHSKPAVSLHVYIPAFDECQGFDQKSGKARKCKVTFYSIDGEKITYCSSSASR